VVRQKPSIEIRREHCKRECRLPVCDGLTYQFKKFPTPGDLCEEVIVCFVNTGGAYSDVVGERKYNSKMAAPKFIVEQGETRLVP
jgi:hypothetical protein